jgi:hypothetical protein
MQYGTLHQSDLSKVVPGEKRSSFVQGINLNRKQRVKLA